VFDITAHRNKILGNSKQFFCATYHIRMVSYGKITRCLAPRLHSP